MRTAVARLAPLLVAACSLTSSLDELQGAKPDGGGGATGGADGGGGTAGASGATGGTGGGGGEDGGADGGLVCGAGTKQCGNECVSASTPELGCAEPTCAYCSLQHAVELGCNAQGACAVAKCEPLYGDCNQQPGDGCETPLNTTAHCGDCGTSCSVNEVCAGEQCVTTCPSGSTNCNGSCVHTDADPDNCGQCGNQCPDAPNGVGACANAQCGVACNVGYAQCEGKCVDTQSDVDNCGACGQSCPTAPNSTRICQAPGVCGLVCQSGWGDCTGAPGCESDLSDSVDHCGACGVVCACQCFNGKCSGGPAC